MAQPSTDASNMQSDWDFLDVVASQGACLVARPNTPVYGIREPEVEIEDFAIALASKLENIPDQPEIRQGKHNDASFEELVEKRDKELETLYALMDAPSPDDSDEKGDLGREEPERTLHKPRIGHHSQRLPAARLPTPSPSDLDSTPNSALFHHPSSFPTSSDIELQARHGKKRRLDGTEESQPKKKKIRTTATEPNRPLRSPGLPHKSSNCEVAGGIDPPTHMFGSTTVKNALQHPRQDDGNAQIGSQNATQRGNRSRPKNNGSTVAQPTTNAPLRRSKRLKMKLEDMRTKQAPAASREAKRAPKKKCLSGRTKRS